MFSLTQPIQGASPLQILLWPLIWLQLLVLRANVRANYGRGVPFAFEISAFGKVRLTRVSAGYQSGTLPAWLVPPEAPAARPVSLALRRLAASLIEPAQPPPAPLRCVRGRACGQPRTNALLADTS